MPRRIELPPCAELRRLYEHEELTTVAIAARCGCAPATVSKALRRCGIQPRDGRFRALMIDGVELRRLYLEERVSLQAIAVAFGCSVSTVRMRCRLLGFPPRR